MTEDRISDILKTYEEIPFEKSQTKLKLLQKALQLAGSINNYSLKYEIYRKLGKHYLIHNQDELALRAFCKMLKQTVRLSDPNKKAAAYFNVAYAFQNLDKTDSAIKAYEKSNVICLRVKNFTDAADNYYNMAIIYAYSNRIDQAIDNYNRALGLRERIKDIYGQINCLNNLGVIYGRMGDMENALKYQLQAYKLIQVENIPQYLIDVNINVGNIYYNLNKIDKALNHYYKVLEILDQNQDSNLTGHDHVYNNIGASLIKKGEYQQAENYFRKSLDVKNKNQNIADIANSLSNLGHIYFVQNDLQKSKEFYKKTLELREKLNNPALIAFSKQRLAQIAIKENDLEQAHDLLERALTLLKDQEFYDLQKDIYLNLYEIDLIQNNFQEALENYKKHAEYDKLHFEKLHSDKLFEMQTKYQVAEKEKETEIYRLKNIELKELNDSMNKFFSIIAHDIKNLFNTIISGSRTLEVHIDKLEKQEIIEYAKDLHNTATNLFQLLENLLQWSRSQIGLLEYKPSRINILRSLQNMITLMENTARTKDLDLIFEIRDDMEAFLDKDLLISITNDLIYNAIKFTPSGGRIKVNAENMDDHLLFSISDNGVGMDKKKLQRLFRLEEHVTTPGTDKEKGTGLGLILCKEFIEKNGGRIWIESELGKGTTVYFTIPVEKISKK